MIMKQTPKRIGRTNMSDLNEDLAVVWQHKHYLQVVLLMGLMVPTLVTGLLWDDWFGGHIYAWVLRIFFLQQAAFCVNSFAHIVGDQSFADRYSPRDQVITALITFGEGSHNFHHEFSFEYCNTIEWHQYDPWFIWYWKQLSLAYDLKQSRSNKIEKGRHQLLQRTLDLRCEKGRPEAKKLRAMYNVKNQGKMILPHF